MKIWIDLSTAPDPLFFRPIIRRLQDRGHIVWITVRDFCETVSIAEFCELSCIVVGQHGGRTIRGKASEIIRRSMQLTRIAKKEKIDIAVSFNSYSQGLAAKLCNIPFVTIMDYEYQPANHLAFRIAKKVIVPLGFAAKALRLQGAQSNKVTYFNGLKEHITLKDFQPDVNFHTILEDFGISLEEVLITMRPPALWSTYHRFENKLFDETVIFLIDQTNVKILLLPRYNSQADYFKQFNSTKLIIPPQVLDGLNLVYWSDIVISAGGSMNREAVVLGTPSYTIFRGKMAGVDRKMITSGIMKNIESSEEIHQISLSKKPATQFQALNDSVIEEVIDAILRL